MSNTYTAVFERDGDWFIAWCPEVPGANGQGRTKEEARASLSEAIGLIFQDRREDALDSFRTTSNRRPWSSGEERRSPAALATARLLPQTGRLLPLALVQSKHGRRAGSSAPPRSPKPVGEEDM